MHTGAVAGRGDAAGQRAQCVAQHVEQAAVQQEARLAGVAEQLQAGIARGARDAAELDVGGDVRQPRLPQRVVVRAVRAVATQRAADALLERPGGVAAPSDRAGVQLAAGVQKLVNESEMGELFKVIALGRGVATPLAGFAAGDRSAALD